jgi:hypothetical protein
MPRGMTKARQLEVEKRRSVVASNVLAGLNYRDIAKGLEVTIGTISNDMKIILKRYREEQVSASEENAILDLRRIDTALNAIWPRVAKGEYQAIDRMMVLLRRRAEILGYDKESITLNLNAVVVETSIEDVRKKRWEQIQDQLNLALSEPGEGKEVG